MCEPNMRVAKPIFNELTSYQLIEQEEETDPWLSEEWETEDLSGEVPPIFNKRTRWIAY